MNERITRLFSPVTTRDHSQGPVDAPFLLLEYGDYQCPYCGSAYAVIGALQATLEDRLRFVFRNFPLNQAHPLAELAAEAAEAAAVQGKFWEMHDALYENQRVLTTTMVPEIAERIGLDMSEWLDDVRQRNFRGRVKEDFISGVKSGPDGTPAFFINGIRYDGNADLSSLLAAIDDLRADKREERFSRLRLRQS